MKISYIESIDGAKLFSFHRHDYREYKDKEENYMMIDGGFDYIRYSVDHNQELSWLDEGEISDLVNDIREQFTWGRNYDKDNNPLPKTEYIKLKDLTTDHIYNILKYFTERIKEGVSIPDKAWKATHLIFIEELVYRFNNKT